MAVRKRKSNNDEDSMTTVFLARVSYHPSGGECHARSLPSTSQPPF
jgi:hypothetical protein